MALAASKQNRLSYTTAAAKVDRASVETGAQKRTARGVGETVCRDGHCQSDGSGTAAGAFFQRRIKSTLRIKRYQSLRSEELASHDTVFPTQER